MAVVNLPFLLLLLPTPLRLPPEGFAPIVSLCLFILPGLAWVTVRSEESMASVLIRVFAGSVGAMAGVIVLLKLLGMTPTLQSWLILSLLVVNGGLLRKTTNANGNLLWQRWKRASPRWLLLGSACLLLYALLFACALVLVPASMEHDWENQSTAYGLLHTLTPLTVTDRGLLYYFSDPPFLSFQIGLVALARGTLDSFSYHYESAKALKEKQGVFPAEPAMREAVHRSQRLFLEDPHLLETRAPTVFFATATLPLLFSLLQELTQSPGLSALGCLLYFTFPEVLVRSSNGGSQAMAAFLLLIMAHGFYQGDRKLLLWGSFLAALARNKQVGILPLAIVLWVGSRKALGPLRARLKALAIHPACVGYLMGTLGFVGYGLWIHPQAFWIDFVRGHFWNRLLHIDTVGSYPSVLRLWWQYHQAQGFPFLPLAAASIGWLLIHSWRRRCDQGVIPLWAIVGSVCFSLIDWRQTKHLFHITPALVVSVMIFTAHQRGARRWALLGLVGTVILHNVGRIASSGGDLLGLHPSGDW